MNYLNTSLLFETRRKGATNKPFGNTMRVFKEGDDFVFSFGWGSDLNHYKPLARLTPDNKAYLLQDIAAVNHGMKNALVKVFGFGSCWSDTNGFGRYEHSTRYCPRWSSKQEYVTYPATVGLVVDVVARTVVAAKPDVVRSTNRKAAKPVYDYVTEVGKVMDVLYRMGAFGNTGYTYVHRKALDDESLPLHSLTEENLSIVAEATYRIGHARTAGVSQYEWKRHPDGGMQRLDIPNYKERQYAADRALGLKLLREKLKSIHGGFDKSVVHTISPVLQAA